MLSLSCRVLIAYQRGLLVLWDITENHATAIRGNGDLHLKQNNFASSELAEAFEEEEEQEEEKEICSLCWASSTGSVAAVGYTTGDIYLWKLSPNKSSSHKGKEIESMSNNALKLQLANGDRRLPVIVLHWSPSSRGDGERGGHLFIYGGEEMGSEEVLTVVSLFPFLLPLLPFFFFAEGFNFLSFSYTLGESHLTFYCSRYTSFSCIY